MDGINHNGQEDNEKYRGISSVKTPHVHPPEQVNASSLNTLITLKHIGISVVVPLL